MLDKANMEGSNVLSSIPHIEDLLNQANLPILPPFLEVTEFDKETVSSCNHNNGFPLPIIEIKHHYKRDNCKKTNRKCLFNPEIESHVNSLISLYGSNNWTTISKALGFRNASECKEYCRTHSSTKNRATRWTYEEDMILIKQYSVLGPKWSKICLFLEGRTANSIKNRWNTLVKKTRIHNYVH